jgi:hypothetical protein
MYLRANQGNKNTPSVAAVIIRGDLSGVLVDLAGEPGAASEFVDNLLRYPVYHANHRSLARLAFSELLADLEGACAMRGDDATEQSSLDLEKAGEILRALYSEARIEGISLEHFLEIRYLVPMKQPITRFAPGFEKPLYRPGVAVLTKVPEAIIQDCLGRDRC